MVGWSVGGRHREGGGHFEGAAAVGADGVRPPADAAAAAVAAHRSDAEPRRFRRPGQLNYPPDLPTTPTATPTVMLGRPKSGLHSNKDLKKKPFLSRSNPDEVQCNPV